ncbi:MAG: DUF721 domain-containing protein [Bacteroidales bacterium]|nr:DUF721 domain-containing protein [Bacteroidales bacterium]
MESKGTRINRKKALSMEEVVGMYIREMKIASGLNTQRIFEAWDKASGLGQYTLRRFFRNGTLYVTMSSSMIRSQLMFQREFLVGRINEILAEDPLFTGDDSRVGYVRELVLK